MGSSSADHQTEGDYHGTACCPRHLQGFLGDFDRGLRVAGHGVAVGGAGELSRNARLPPVLSGDNGRLFVVAGGFPPLTERVQALGSGYGDEKFHPKSFMLGAKAARGFKRFLTGGLDVIEFTALGGPDCRARSA